MTAVEAEASLRTVSPPLTPELVVQAMTSVKGVLGSHLLFPLIVWEDAKSKRKHQNQGAAYGSIKKL